MKKLFFFVGLLLFYHAKAQNLDSLMASNSPTDRQLLHERLASLAGSNIESEMSVAAGYYFRLKEMKTFDSISTAELIKFPKGQLARIKAQQAITAMKQLPEMEKAYHQFMRNFPPESFPRLAFGEDRLTYDRVRLAIASGYAKEKNTAKTAYYASMLEADFWKVHSYSIISEAFYANGDLMNATLYQKKAVESAAPFAERKIENSPTAQYAIKGYPEACRTYAWYLYEQKKYPEALKYIKAAGRSGAAYDYTYAAILSKLNHNQEAYEKMEAVVKSGEATKEMSALFKELYVKTRGDTIGLNAFQADIHKGVIDHLRRELTKRMINEPAADFTLTDLQGNRVSLASLKGKIVILDFWATWCVPCKASFPAMQMAIDKYKNDSTIRFLFIHTWERTSTPVEDAREYISSMKYNFEVLMDTKDPESKANKVVDSYNISSIPAKFVIDEKGNVRFKLKGFNGSSEGTLDELSECISLIREKMY